MAPTAVVISGFHMLSTVSWNINDMPGTSSHHTANEPRQMMNVYLRPMM